VDELKNIVQLAPSVKSLFPERIIATQIYGTASPRLLLAEEQRCVESAVQKRQSEFAAGRACARRALTTLGFLEAPLLVAHDRTPLWPKGAVGSISHTDGYCIAVAGLARHFTGVGVDTELLGRVEPTLWQHVFRPEEIERLKSLNESRQAEVASVMFSAKEAFYKCQFAQTRAWLGFEDVAVETDGNIFQVLVYNTTAEAILSQRLLHGKFAIDGSRVVCGMAIQT
jgi:4'-phosphopantetheinyl transferase EntD